MASPRQSRRCSVAIAGQNADDRTTSGRPASSRTPRRETRAVSPGPARSARRRSPSGRREPARCAAPARRRSGRTCPRSSMSYGRQIGSRVDGLARDTHRVQQRSGLALRVEERDPRAGRSRRFAAAGAARGSRTSRCWVSPVLNLTVALSSYLPARQRRLATRISQGLRSCWPVAT